jgi:pantoate--beta-alanine ligase
VEVCPTMRAPDGLALSSRNALLSPSQRDRATALHRALAAVRDAVRAGERDPDAATEAGRAELAAAGIEPEYLKVVSPETMEPVERIEGDALAVIAARIGSVRLIDNVLVGTTVEQPAEPADQAEVSRMSHTIRNTDHEVATPFGAPTI